MKIYTKTGDKGSTSLVGGTRVAKHHIRIETYGTVDELNAAIAVFIDHLPSSNHKTRLLQIQNTLFTLGSLLAAETEEISKKMPPLHESKILELEQSIDDLNKKLPPLRDFILPGGHVAISFCHLARAICRRAERQVSLLAVHESVNMLIIKYLNRLSDYLFTLSRSLAAELGVEEKKWKKNL